MFAPYAYLIAIVIAWGVAHLLKYGGALVRRETGTLREHLFRSGGMPSAHSAVIVAITALIGLSEGFDSALFGLAVAVTLVVIYDATHVRRMAGLTAEIVAERLNTKHKPVSVLKVSHGHTPVEVLAGALLGALIGLVVFLATK